MVEVAVYSFFFRRINISTMKMIQEVKMAKVKSRKMWFVSVKPMLKWKAVLEEHLGFFV